MWHILLQVVSCLVKDLTALHKHRPGPLRSLCLAQMLGYVVGLCILLGMTQTHQIPALHNNALVMLLQAAGIWPIPKSETLCIFQAWSTILNPSCWDCIPVSTLHDHFSGLACAHAVNQEDFDLKRDYLNWRRGLGFSFCGRYSFLYGPAAKAQLLRMENRGQQMNEFQGALYQTIVSGAGALPFLYLRVGQ